MNRQTFFHVLVVVLFPRKTSSREGGGGQDLSVVSVALGSFTIDTRISDETEIGQGRAGAPEVGRIGVSCRYSLPRVAHLDAFTLDGVAIAVSVLESLAPLFTAGPNVWRLHTLGVGPPSEETFSPPHCTPTYYSTRWSRLFLLC